MSLDVNPNLTILESLFFGRNSVPKGLKLNKKNTKLSTSLPLTEDGLIKNSKSPYFQVGLGATLIDSKRGLTPENYAGVIEIRSVAREGKPFEDIDDGLDVLPDGFMEPLGRVNDQIESNSNEPFDEIGLILPKEKKIVTLEDLRKLKPLSVNVADRFELTLEELVEHMNRNGISLDDLAKIDS